jgi:Fur family ferric uptake transcriptional regulator
VQSGDETLRQRGYRLTPQRHLILQILRDEPGHLTTEQLLERARKHYPSATLSTVYRTLDLLKELQLVREIHFPGEAVAYEAFLESTHHHLVCRQCGSILHLDISLQRAFYEAVQQQSGFHNITMDIMSTGYCDTCWSQQQSGNICHTKVIPTSIAHDQIS